MLKKKKKKKKEKKKKKKKNKKKKKSVCTIESVKNRLPISRNINHDLGLITFKKGCVLSAH